MIRPLLEILPEPQQRIWPALARLSPHFILYGGTAVALRLGHRVSVDFDFFSDIEIDEAAKEEILQLFDVDSILQNDQNTLVFDVVVDGHPVKLSFFGGLGFGCVSVSDVTDDGVACIASLEDLLAHKLKAIHDRAEGKDYQDIAVMLMNGQSLARGLAAREALFGSSVPSMLTLKALMYFDDVSEPERISGEMKRTIVEAVRQLPDVWEPVPILTRSLAQACDRRHGNGFVP